MVKKCVGVSRSFVGLAAKCHLFLAIELSRPTVITRKCKRIKTTKSLVRRFPSCTCQSGFRSLLLLNHVCTSNRSRQPNRELFLASPCRSPFAKRPVHLRGRHSRGVQCRRTRCNAQSNGDERLRRSRSGSVFGHFASRVMFSEWLLNSGAYMHSMCAKPVGYLPRCCTRTAYSNTYVPFGK